MSKTIGVLFVCTANYLRSRFAEAVFNYYADLSGLPERAGSRGLSPQALGGELSPQVRAALDLRGIPFHYVSPCKRALTRDDLEQIRRIIALQEDEHRPLMRFYFPDWADRIEYWSAGNEQRLGIGSVLSSIDAQVRELVATLAREHASRPD